MKKTLSNIAILALRGLERTKREEFAKFAGVHIDTVSRWIRTNDDELTTASNLSFITQVLGVKDASQILEETEPVTS